MRSNSQINKIFIILFAVSSFSYALFAKPINVTLISPATKKEVYWNNIHNIAKSSAANFNMNFEILYSNRLPISAVKIATELTKRKVKPDYVIVVAENFVASRAIPILSNSGIHEKRPLV